MKKRFRMLALLLSACMMLNLAPMSVLAAEVPTDTVDVVTVEESSEEEAIQEESPEEETPAVEETVVDTEEKENEEVKEEVPAEEETEADEELALDEEALDADEELLADANKKDYLFTVDAQGTLQFNNTAKRGTASSNSNKITISQIDLTAKGDDAVIDPDAVIIKIPGEIFAGNDKITKVIIPTSVTTIEEAAFDGCTALSSVRFENDETGITAFPKALFRGCSSLAYSDKDKAQDFIIPNGLESIGEYCFQDCTKLSGVDFSKAKTLAVVGNYAFDGCTALSVLKNFNQTAVTTIATKAFANTAINRNINLPKTLVTIGSYVFEDCDDLYSIDLSGLNNGSALTIGKGAFADSGLNTIKLPDAYRTLASGVFYNCKNLAEIKLGSYYENLSIERIETGAFENCDNLETVELLESVKVVANNAFIKCNKINTIKSYQGKALEDGNSMTLYHDSFPANNGLVVYGYTGNIEDWVGKHVADGVTFRSLYTGLEFKKNNQYGGNSFDVKGSAGSVSIGATATVTVAPASGYTLVSMTHGAKNEFVSAPANNKYTFTITGADVDVDGKIPVNVAFANISKNDTKFRFEIDEVNGVKQSTSGEIWTPGQSVPLRIMASNRNYDKDVASNPWLWTFSSSNPKCAKVDSNGKIQAISSTKGTKDGYVTVTATLKANTKVKVSTKVYVASTQTFNKLSSEVKFSKANKMTFGTDEATGLQSITVSKSWVELATKAKGTRDVKVTVNALDTADAPMEMGFTWKSSNTAIAKVTADTQESTNTVKICGVGETVITATSKEKSVSTKKNESISFIVRVVDKTPVVSDSSIVINSKSRLGTDFDIVRAYDGAISNEDIKIVTLSNGKWVENDKDFSIGVVSEPVERADGDYNQTLNIGLYADSSYVGKETSVSGLYVKCLVDESDYVYIKLPTVKITAKAPSPKVTISGKINTFYKATAATKTETSVTVKIAKVTGYELDTSKAIELDSLESDTSNVFEDNFTVTSAADDFSEVVISQLAEELKNDVSTNKPALTGYLVIPYKGDITAKVKITIGTQKVAPTYVLSQTTVTTNKNASGQKFDVQLLDKKTKKVIDLTSDYKLDKYEANSTPAFTSYKPELDTENDKIKVTMPNILSANSKAIIVVKNNNWNGTLTYPLTVKVITTNPKVVLGTTKLAINVVSATKNNTTVSMKEDYISGVTVNVASITTKATGKAKLEAEKISWSFVNGKLEATVKADKAEQPKVGSYVFKVPYTGTYLGGATFDATVDVTVQIVEKKPSITLKSGKVTLNDALYGVVDNGTPAEVATTAYTVNNLPANDNYAVDVSEANLIDVTNAKSPIDYGVGKDGWTSAPVKVGFKDNKLCVSLNKMLGKTYKYKLTGVKIDGVVVEPIAFTVASINKQPTIKLAAKGTINVLDDNTAITYTLTVANYSGVVDPKKLELITEYVPDSTNNKVGTYKDIKNGEIPGHFVFNQASVDGNKINLIVNDAARSDLQGIAYKINTDYVFGVKGGDEYTSAVATITPKPTQTMPKLTQSEKEIVLYAANARYGKSLTVKTDKNSTVSIDGIAWSKNTSKEIKDAFAAPIFDSKTGKLTIKIKNSALLKKNTSYTLKYCMVNNHQLTGNNVQGTEFTVKVTVK